MGKLNGHSNGYLPPDQAARELVKSMEKSGYNFDLCATDRSTMDRLPEYVEALGAVLGWPKSYMNRVMRIARTARGRCGFADYSDRTL